MLGKLKPLSKALGKLIAPVPAIGPVAPVEADRALGWEE